MTTIVHLPCGHAAAVDHDMGERLITCISHDEPIEHIVAAVHTNAVTYEARRRFAVPSTAAEEVDVDG